MNQEDELRQKIITRSFELFKKHGINCVTMDAIANKLGVSKKTLYVHFKSKKELLLETLQNFRQQNKYKHRDTIKEAPNVLKGMISIVQQFLSEFNQMNPLIFDELDRYYPEISKVLWESHWVDDHKDLVNLLEEGKNEGLISNEINSNIAAKLFLLQIQHITTNPEVFPIEDYPRSILFKHIFITFLRGMVTKKGMALLDDLDY